MSHVTCHMSHVPCHVSHLTCHISHVQCHVQHVTCHVSPVIFFFSFSDKVVKLVGVGSVTNALCPKKKFNLKCLSQSIFLSVTKTRCYCEFVNFPTRESSVSSTHFTLLLIKNKSTFFCIPYCL